MRFSPLPARDELLAKLDYEPVSGALVWRVDIASTCPAGTRAGMVTKKGYLRLKFDGTAYLAHRVIWKMMTGEEPFAQIDHIDLDKTNNTWANLRAASNSQNAMNRPAIGLHGLPKGVSFHRRIGKYQVRIKRDGVRSHLGYFDTIDAAAAAYRAAATEKFGSFARAA